MLIPMVVFSFALRKSRAMPRQSHRSPVYKVQECPRGGVKALTMFWN